jgi:uncharacterized 2Fe-2S/4Fe-4S cluster protein (DUF4445 family)
MSYTIHIDSHGKSLSAQKGDLLVDKILHAGINLSVACDKKGLCGKCLVEIVDGNLSPPNEQEKYLMEQKNYPQNFRLACSYRITGNVRIKIPEESITKDMLVLTSGLRSSVSVDSAVKKFHLQLPRPEISSPLSLMEILKRRLKEKRIQAPFGLMRDMGKILEKSRFDLTAVMYKNKELLNLEPRDTQSLNYGLAIDIGTTTVALEIVNLNTGETIGTSTALNSQSIHGADVVSRISYAYQDPNKLYKLRDEIRGTLNSMINNLLKKTKTAPSNVYDITVAGNTAMNHLFLGLSVDTLALAPFNSVFDCLPELSSRDLGFRINPYGKVYVAPNIKSFVGGDISAGLVASDLANKKGIYLYIDLGTNGEIVLKNEKDLIATSTAAGPAFEGMNISCGMLAQPGAIYKAEYGKKLKIYTLRNRPALGICGTGLIDLVAILLEQGKISPSGKLNDREQKIHIKENIFLSQNDVREIQLACAAIKTGIKMILEEFHLTKEELHGIYIAGAFGNYLNIENAMKIGLLPRIDEDKIAFIGNASLAGAKTLLISAPSRKVIEALVKKIRFISLASRPSFQQNFVEAIEFSQRL